MKEDSCRFCRLYAVCVVAIGSLLGLVLTLQAWFGLDELGRAENLPRIVVLSILRTVAPAASGSALLLALLLWAHPLTPSALSAELAPTLKRALLVALPGYAVAAFQALATSLLLGGALLGVLWASFAAAVGVVRGSDVVAGGMATLLDAGLIVLLAWRFLGRLQQSRLSLPAKLAVAWTASVLLRSVVGLMFSSVLPH